MMSYRSTIRAVAIAVAGLVLAACRGSASAASPDEAGAVRAARAAQNAAIIARDFDRMASYWTDSVTLTAGLGTELRGRVAYRRAFEQDSAITYQRTPRVVEVSAKWPLAWEQGTWTGRGSGDGDAVPRIGGSYAAQWVKVGGRWLIRSELFVATSCQGVACRWPAAQP
jgi:ketosteroid isomerase-like protein